MSKKAIKNTSSEISKSFLYAVIVLSAIGSFLVSTKADATESAAFHTCTEWVEATVYGDYLGLVDYVEQTSKTNWTQIKVINTIDKECTYVKNRDKTMKEIATMIAEKSA